ALAFISVVLLLHLPNPSSSFCAKFKLIDWWGTFTLVAATILLLLSLNWGGSKYGWNNPIIIILLCLGGIGYILFAFIEGKIAKDPIAPGRLFKNPKVAACFSINFFHGMIMVGLLYFVPLYFQVVKSESATNSGLELLPYILGLVVASMSIGQLVSRTTFFSYGLICIVGSILMGLGAGLISLFSKDTDKGQVIGYLLISGLGVGFITQTTILAGQGIVEHKDVASVTSLLAFFRTIGAVFGVAILGTVFNNVFNSNLPPEFQGKVSLHDFGTSALDKIPDVIIQTFLLALNTAIRFLIGMSALALISSLPIINVKPHRDSTKKA
ncbi:4200_t:CDS:2, partial [Racocetra persica]